MGIGLVFLLAIGGIYFIVPKLLGFDEAIDRIDDAVWYWIVIAVVFNVGAFGAYVALFRGILGGRDSSEVRERLDARASYQITMAGLAATQDLLRGGRRRDRAHLLGAAQGGDAAGGGRRAGWWPFSCSPTRCTWVRW